MSEPEEQRSNTSEPTKSKQRLTKTLALSGLVFAVALVAGRYLGRGPERAVPPVTAQKANPAGGKVYNIPVSISQAVLGPEDALVTLVQWCDFPDPGCKGAEPAVQALLKRYPSELRLVFRHFLLDKSVAAHQFARAAFEQSDKFWEARALLLADDGPYTEAKLEGYARELGLDWSNVKSAIDKQRYGSHLMGDRVFAKMFDVSETPAFFANGRALEGAPSQQALENLVKSELASAQKLVAQGIEKKKVYAELTKNGAWTRPIPKSGSSKAPSFSSSAE